MHDVLWSSSIPVSYCLNNPLKKVIRNFDNTFQLVDLWLANETTFEKKKNER